MIEIQAPEPSLTLVLRGVDVANFKELIELLHSREKPYQWNYELVDDVYRELS